MTAKVAAEPRTHLVCLRDPSRYLALKQQISEKNGNSEVLLQNGKVRAHRVCAPPKNTR